MVVDKPKKGIVLNNIIEVDEHNTGIRCPYLRGDIAGQYACAIHEKSWYNETPCYAFGQIESISGTLCRMGKCVMEKNGKGGKYVSR